MALSVEKLKPLQVARAGRPGYYGDGAGLYLQVSPSGSKSWIFRFKLAGKAREMGLGSFNAFTLAEARQRAKAARQLLADGIDPIEERSGRLAAQKSAAAGRVTFREEAERFIEAQRAGWKNEKHAWQWQQTLAAHAYPVFGDRDVAAVDADAVVAALQPLWLKMPETASRLRGRIEKVLDAATSAGRRSGDNPARLKGNLVHRLPKQPSKRERVTHHRALPYSAMPAFMRQLRAAEGTGARALELVVLTAGRSGEVRGARWEEVDLEDRVWTVPGSRMKAKVAHRVPLPDAAIELLERLPGRHGLIFPGPRGAQLSDMTLAAVMKRLGADATPHGCRSTFRDWAAEQTSYPREVAEAALAHTLENKTEAAYRRSDLFEKRRALMADWAAFIGTTPTAARVTPIRKDRAARTAA